MTLIININGGLESPLDYGTPHSRGTYILHDPLHHCEVYTLPPFLTLTPHCHVAHLKFHLAQSEARLPLLGWLTRSLARWLACTNLLHVGLVGRNVNKKNPKSNPPCAPTKPLYKRSRVLRGNLNCRLQYGEFTFYLSNAKPIYTGSDELWPWCKILGNTYWLQGRISKESCLYSMHSWGMCYSTNPYRAIVLETAHWDTSCWLHERQRLTPHE